MIRLLLVAFIIVFAAAIPSVNIEPVAPLKLSKDCFECIEAFRYENNKIYVAKSEICRADVLQKAMGMTEEVPRKRVWVEVYIAVRGKICLYKIIMGRITPASAEQWHFEDYDVNDFK